MNRTMQHLNDEHMQLYEWSGAGTGMRHTLPTGAKRDHPWHASYGVLAALTTLLILNGCGSKSPTEQAGELRDSAMAASGPGQESGPPGTDRQNP